MPKIKNAWHILEKMEKLHKDAVGREFTQDEAEDFRSYTLSTLAQLCGIVDELRGDNPFKK